MHEYALASSLLAMAERHARAEGADRVRRVEIRVGGSAGVEIELLETAWSQVRGEGPCRGAELVVHCVPTRWVCALCRSPVPAGAVLRCAECDVAAVLDGGDDLLLERVALERTAAG